MKILYVAPKYDYGKPERGLSFEHYNFFDTLYHMGNEIIYFDYMDILGKIGKRHMNELLLETFNKELPELVFVFLFENELYSKTVSQISKNGKSITLNWFADDHWRFENYSKYWAPSFNCVVTTDSEAIPKYQEIGYPNAILSQWGCNHFLYKNLKLNSCYEASFIGQVYGNRKAVISRLRSAGINVETRGQGWPSGRASQKEMIEIINRSKINLNLSNASIEYTNKWISQADRFALYTPVVKRIWRKIRPFIPTQVGKPNLVIQIKGRNFEIPGCGGFLLTDYVHGLENYYKIDQEIVCYHSVNELVEKVRYYLANDKLRQHIAENGFNATLEKHTYVHRFNEIFREIGLRCDYSLEKIMGSCIEISKLVK